MRQFMVIGLGLLVVTASACGSSDANNNKTATPQTCKAPTDCPMGSVCGTTGTCVALSGTGGDMSMGAGGGFPIGGTTSTGGTAQGGVPMGAGGIVVGGGGNAATGGVGIGNGGGSGAAGDSGTPATGGQRGDASTPPGDGGHVVVPGSVNSVPCGDTSCSDRDSCCGTTGTGGTQFACSKSACTTGAPVSMSCDGPEDCASGQKCCQTGGTGFPGGGGGFTYACAAQCTRAEIGCGGPENCATGSVCCATVTTGAAQKTACEPSACAQGEYQLCRANSDCPQGMNCQASPSPYLPGLRYCG